MKSKKKKITTSKLLIGFIFVNCIVVEVYAMWAMYKLADLSALSVLVTSIIGETIAYAIYSVKSMKENSMGGIVYDLAMQSELQTELQSEETNEKG